MSALLAGMSASAQNAYPEEDEPDVYQLEVKYSGQRPTITDFVDAYLAEPEDELSGQMYEALGRYKAGQPMVEGQKVTIDVKNGFACFEFSYVDEEAKSTNKTTVEMCYWNSSDGNHKVFATSCYSFVNGKAMSGGQFDGLSFFVYNNGTHRLTGIGRDEMGAEVEFEQENITHGVENDKYFVKNLDTGEQKQMTEDEYFDWLMYRPTVVYELPRSGKNITATIHNLKSGPRKVQLVWNGLRFKQE